jgi:hypothetical protein
MADKVDPLKVTPGGKLPPVSIPPSKKGGGPLDTYSHVMPLDEVEPQSWAALLTKTQ